MMRVYLGLLLILCFVAFSGCKKEDNATNNNAAPTISGFTPASVARSQTNVTGTISGTNFTGIVVVDLGPDIQIKNTILKSATEITVKFNVSSTAEPGSRTIRVITAGGTAENATVFSILDNRPPVASFAVTPSHGARNTLFSLDAAGSSDPDGSIVSYDWEFGDGTIASGQLVQHQYTAAGTFHAILTVKDNGQATANTTHDILVDNTVPPVAHFNFSPPEGTTETNFKFDGSASTDDKKIAKYLWDFQDGTAEGKIVNHKFKHSDRINVKLTVVDGDDLESFVEKEVTIRGIPPVASFTVTPSSGDTSTTFHFDASESADSDGRIIRYKWNFADGVRKVGQTVDHKFAADGNFNVVLVVVDNDEKTHSVERPVNVGGGGGGGNPQQCTNTAPNNGMIYGTVVDVVGNNAIVRLPAGSTCANSYYYCGDMRRANPEQFRGIIHAMSDLGNGTFSIFNDCPFVWPPAIGEQVFLYWKTCAANYCP